MWNTLSNAHTEEAWSNHWLLILRKVHPLSLPSKAMDRAFFKLLSGGRPGASHWDISIKQGSVWICVCTGLLGAQGEEKHGDLGWGWGRGSLRKGSRGILLLWRKETCRRALQWGQEVSPQNRSSAFLSATPSLPLTIWTPTSLTVVASVVGRQGCEKTFSSRQYSDSVTALPRIPSLVEPERVIFFCNFFWRGIQSFQNPNSSVSISHSFLFYSSVTFLDH